MENREMISSHDLQSDYSIKGKLKRIIIGWCIFLVIFGVTRVPSLQAVLLDFESNLGVEWVTSSINFIINGLIFVFIPMIIGTILTLRAKHSFKELCIYKEGIGFVENDGEKFALYNQIELSWGKMQESFYIGCKELEIKTNDYGFGEFSQPDVLMNNLKRYSNLG